MPRSLRRRGSRRAAAVVAAAAALAVVAGCAQEPSPDGPLRVWTLENLPDRLAAQEELAAAFTEDTGVEVELVGIDENQFNQLLISSAAAGTLPDVVGALSLAGVRNLAANELLDTETPAAIIEDLGEETFSERALELTRDGDTQLSVPSDAWAQLLLYRSDLFEDAGLDPPDTYESILAAAEALDTPEVAGFVGATVPNDAFTQQSFEHLALGNGCEMVDDDGAIALDSDQCVESFALYDTLIGDYSVVGAQDVDTTRATYFAGQAAMVIWSSFILDELAGLREDAKPTCAECDDETFLVENTGVVTAIQGPDGEEPAQFGEVVSWAVIAETAKGDKAQEFVAYMMDAGYEDWIGFAPEGKIPTRQGTPDEPTRFLDVWETLPAGVDTKAPLSDFYAPETLEELRASPDSIQRWGITQGAGNLVGATIGELPVPQALSAMTSGGESPEEAAERAAADVDALRRSLE